MPQTWGAELKHWPTCSFSFHHYIVYPQSLQRNGTIPLIPAIPEHPPPPKPHSHLHTLTLTIHSALFPRGMTSSYTWPLSFRSEGWFKPLSSPCSVAPSLAPTPACSHFWQTHSRPGLFQSQHTVGVLQGGWWYHGKVSEWVSVCDYFGLKFESPKELKVTVLLSTPSQSSMGSALLDLLQKNEKNVSVSPCILGYLSM